MWDFFPKYAKIRPTKDCVQNPTYRKIIIIQQENNDIVNYAVDEILLQENIKVSAEAEAHINIESKLEENDIYQTNNTSLYDKWEKIEWRKRAFESELENKYEIEIQNGMTCIHGHKLNK